ncbi:kelch-like protein [Anaeramoeba ignava]|uniref:Kelch-like protein n=1 Tax=Anaeramoeba ignava TaxID=1746090 RepID=A0A9Q0R6G8_ANAIG|nr:kelch-like protein [Anaeramoeba ignava]
MFMIVEDDSTNSAPDLSGRSAESIRDLIQYFYTGKVDHINNFQIATELLDAPSYYGIDTSRLSIQTKCAEIIGENLNLENIISFCYSSFEFDNVLLQDLCIEFIKENFEKLESQGLDDLINLIMEEKQIDLKWENSQKKKI